VKRSSNGAPPARTGAAPDARLAWEIGVLLGGARRLMFAELQRQFEEKDESVQTWRALNQLERLGRAAQCELAHALAQDPGATSRLLDELENDGLVTRRRDAKDRRRVWVELTTRGHSRYEAMRPVVSRALDQIMAPLSDADCRSLSRLLGKLVQPGVTRGAG
jgi:MarR family 2-MHQ and catechol resistance regulon transcriptional repressor